MYKIYVNAPANLSICTGTYESFESAKEQLYKMIIYLITENEHYDSGEWETWKKGFPEEVQAVLTSLELNGFAPAGDYDLDGEAGNNGFVLRNNDLDIDIVSEDQDVPVYEVSTDAFETDEERETFGFYLWKSGEGLIIQMVKDDE